MYLLKLIRFWSIKGRYKLSSNQFRFWEEFGRKAIENKNIPLAEIAKRKLHKINKKKDYLIAEMECLFAE